MPMHAGSIVVICICILFLLHPIDNTLVVPYQLFQKFPAF